MTALGVAMRWPDTWPLSSVAAIQLAQRAVGPGRCFSCGAKLTHGRGRKPMQCGSDECTRRYLDLYRSNPGAWRARRRAAISRGHRRRLYVPPVTLGSEEAARLADSTFGGGP